MNLYDSSRQLMRCKHPPCSTSMCLYTLTAVRTLIYCFIPPSHPASLNSDAYKPLSSRPLRSSHSSLLASALKDIHNFAWVGPGPLWPHSKMDERHTMSFAGHPSQPVTWRTPVPLFTLALRLTHEHASFSERLCRTSTSRLFS